MKFQVLEFPRPSRTKSIALAAFGVLRSAQHQAAQVPGMLSAAARDIAEAWQETGDQFAKKV